MLSIAYLCLSLVMIFFELLRKKSHPFDFLTLFSVIYLLLYPVPGFLLSSNIGNLSSIIADNDILYTGKSQTLIAIFAGYFFVIFGFYSKSSQKLGKKILIKSRNDKVIISYAILLLLLSCLSIQIYSLQYGGFVDALSQTALIRSNAVDSGSLVFFKHFIMFSVFSSYILAAFAFNTKNQKYRFLICLIFAFSVVISILGCMLSAGRLPLIYYFFTLYFAYVFKTEKFLLGLVIPLLGLMVLFILYGKALFFSLSAIPEGYGAVASTFLEAIDSNQSDSGGTAELISNFVFAVNSLDTAFSTQYDWRLFIDWYYGILSFLPEKLVGIAHPYSVTFYNTQYIAGDVDYSIPPGMLASGVYSMSWSGLFITCFSYGWIGRYLQTILDNHINNILWIPYIYVATSQVWADFQVSGDPAIYLTINFWFLIPFCGLIFPLSKISINRNNQKISKNQNYAR